MNRSPGPYARPSIMTLVAYYLPGDRGGGPTRSIANLVDALGDDFEFTIVTSDHDLGERSSYRCARQREWTRVGKALVYYVRPGVRGWLDIVRILHSSAADVIYLNSFFSFAFSILPITLNACRRRRALPIIVAPRGELSRGALGLKHGRKALYLAVARLAGVYRTRRCTFHASNSEESRQIQEQLTEVRTFTASPFAGPMNSRKDAAGPDVRAASGAPALPTHTVPARRKAAGALKVVWMSRIARKKNLDTALKLLADVTGSVCLTVYGPIEDTRYWGECQQIMLTLPAHITAHYAGVVRHADVIDVLSRHDVFLLPTRGENYGHIICEALAAGCPIVISDQTPWRDLAMARVGWDLPLADHAGFVRALQACIDMESDAFTEFSCRARAYGMAHRDDPHAIQQHRQLFGAATGAQPVGINRELQESA
jgi:glycosyltransferase involved in cell wall biosynthesis